MNSFQVGGCTVALTQPPGISPPALALLGWLHLVSNAYS